MTDIVDAPTRSRMMAGIRGADTKPEMLIRRGLHARGFRYRLHGRDLPGRPDLVFPSRRAVIFVHGCFWHGHGCPLFRWPASRPDFWREKITANIRRDAASEAALAEAGWHVLLLWECALKGRARRPVETVLEEVATWLRAPFPFLEIAGAGARGRAAPLC